jgi:hypothetical protein
LKAIFILFEGPEKKHFSKAASDVMSAKTVKAINRLRSDSSLLKNYDCIFFQLLMNFAVGDLESEMQSLRTKSHQLNEQYNKKMSPQPRPTVPGPSSVDDTEESKTQSTEQIVERFEPKIEKPSNPIPESKMEKRGFSDKAFQTTVVASPQNARKAEKPILKKDFSKQSKSDAVLPTIKHVPSVGYSLLSMSMPQLAKTHFVPVQFCSAPSTTIQRTSSLSALQRPSVGFNISFEPITKDEVEGKIVGSGAFTPVSTLIL